MKNKGKVIKRKYLNNERYDIRTTLFLIITMLLTLLPLFMGRSAHDIEHEIRKMENAIHKRQSILEKYAVQALKTPDDQWFSAEDLPSDMIIYKYVNDTLQSWANEFPIANDEINQYSIWHRGIQYTSNSGSFSYPLPYIGIRDEYINLGSGWYIVKAYKQGRTRIITALLVKTEYENENSILVNRTNSKLKIGKSMSIEPLAHDEGYIVKSKSGLPLLTVTYDCNIKNTDRTAIVNWLSLLFLLITLISYHAERRKLKSYILLIAGLVLVRIIANHLMGGSTQSNWEIFSPSLYADTLAFKSLGSLLLNNIFIFITIAAAYMMRKKFLHILPGLNPVRRKSVMVSSILLMASLILYIHYSLVSIVENSSIMLEVNRITETSIYTILVLSTYALLYISLFLIIQLTSAMFWKKYRYLMTNWKTSTLFIFIISLHTLLTISICGYNKEVNRNRVWANKLSVERDLSLELQLSLLEHRLNTDPILRLLAEQASWNITDIKNRISEVYLPDASKKYDIIVSVCKDNDLLKLDNITPPTGCLDHYNHEILEYGIPLHSSSNIFFLNNFNGKASYLAVVTFRSETGNTNLFIEIESKLANDTMGYPVFLVDHKQFDNISMPGNYSYAKYLDNRLTFYKGRYNYPVSTDQSVYQEGYSVIRERKYLHFVNRISPDNLVIITRPRSSVLPYIISLSYIVLFYGGFFTVLFKLRKQKPLIVLYKNSFKRRITLLLTASLVLALVAMAIGTTMFVIKQYNEINRVEMDTKLSTTKTTLQNFCKFAHGFSDINTPLFYDAVNMVSANTQVDINLYDPHGRLVRSTQPEIFETFLKGNRINSNAYYEIIYKKSKELINKESIENIDFWSLYAPIYNDSGQLITIVNIPYFSKNSNISKEASYIVAAIINIFILLLIAAIFGGSAISNSMAKPLAEISKKMKYMDISKKVEHINYKKNDELGVLVKAYNKMVDDLEESTRQIAQSERETAWREMARQIAHEIKNPLTPMKLSIQYLIRLKSQNIPNWQDKFDNIAVSLIEQIDILTDVASEFSSFARFYTEDLSEVNLNTLIKEQKALFDSSDNIKFEIRELADNAVVMIRKSQITRVFVNLISNGIQALDGFVNGYIRITIAKEGNSYVMSFEDNGAGVPEENIGKLFKPNFTTKSSGTGLGLAICNSIMKQSQGSIEYKRSEELGGANFTIRIPI